MSETKPNRTKNIIIALLVLAVVVIGYLLTRSSGEVDDLAAEKESLITNLEQMRSELKATQTDNDSMSTYIDAEEKRLSLLIDSVKGANDVSEKEMKRWKNSYYRLKKSNDRLAEQVDSMNAAYDALNQEKLVVEDSLQGEVVKNEVLSEENRELNKNVAVGSMLQLSKLEVAAYKVRSGGKEKETTSASGADRIKACYTVAKNLIAESGEREVYMRITTPDLKVLASDEPNHVFNFNGQPLMFSSKQAVFYENDIIESCINLDKKADLVKGEYMIELYTEGYKLGEAKLILD